jgi:energy-coupling factor transport system permease protein
MTKELEFDPRTKLIIVMCISTLGIIIKDSLPLFLIWILTILIDKLFKINLKRSFKKN